jgi:chorismate mutase
MENELNKLRKKIDHTDEQILALIAKRLDLCYEVGQVKRKQGKNNFLDEDRWQEVLNSKKTLGKTMQLDEKFVEDIYNIIHQYALKIERENKR